MLELKAFCTIEREPSFFALLLPSPKDVVVGARFVHASVCAVNSHGSSLYVFLHIMILNAAQEIKLGGRFARPTAFLPTLHIVLIVPEVGTERQILNSVN